MGTYTGTNKADTIDPYLVSPSVIADPPGSRPSLAPDIIDGLGGDDWLMGCGGPDRINGGDGNDRLGSELDMDEFYTDKLTGTAIYHGGDGNDKITSSFYSNGTRIDVSCATYKIYGDAGDDSLSATYYFYGAQNDKYGAANDFLYGGTGNDTYWLSESRDMVIEKPSQGTDTVNVGFDYTLPDNVENLHLFYADVERGFHGTGNALDNVIMGTDAYSGDVLDGAAGNDRIFGDYGDDLIYGGTGNDSLAGQAGDDSLWGGAGNDHLGGGTGDDLLYGEDGVDVLTGRDGADRLSGGAGNDRFVYEATTDSKAGAANHDTILDMTGIGGAGGDRIDLHKIDASTTTGGDQAFTFVSSTAALKAGQVHVVAGSGSDSLVQGEVDGKAGIDFEILVQDGATRPGDWVAADFIL